MELIFKLMMGFVAFGAIAVLFASLIGLTIWLLLAFARALAGE